MILHTLNRSPATSRVYQQTLDAMASEDRLLLIEDGVQGALPSLSPLFGELSGRLYVLQEDVISRGLEERCDPSIHVVNVDGFVLLTEEADKIVSWF
ncbi:sulfurtransferase complex subunit TusB [Aidingimonas halophila]|uniref:tRNA 2-thiouridine synthesizing protein B n=1 Tax=Aidingimonas halophila TaxID=574349 RepID=A0A1H3BHE3_9GAMM|nr:sulfurtransferase complex subunit TusB [Aidingimonas halophila]GHC26526.1 hypothetical protein GCM10008094_17350 [Aidingimonas halophila]SDX41327.1 tRNA 2-thiouridine synthesizing protein B [Aidingimonas halophila]